MFEITWLHVSLLLNVVLIGAWAWEARYAKYWCGVAFAVAAPPLPALELEQDDLLWPEDKATCKMCEEVVEGFLTIRDSDGRQVCTTCACW